MPKVLSNIFKCPTMQHFVIGFIILLAEFLTKIQLAPHNVLLHDNLQHDFVKREQWFARKPTSPAKEWKKAVELVVIHHSYQPGVCNTSIECQKAMLSMQNYHQSTLGWSDIGYNFAIGGDGRIYEGRGFQIIGAHTLHYNQGSLGICFIGDWRAQKPYKEMVMGARNFIRWAVEQGYIASNYLLMGHGQLSPTECPGTQLLEEISKWDHFSLQKPINSYNNSSSNPLLTAN